MLELRCYQDPTLFPIRVSFSHFVSSHPCIPFSPIHVHITLLCSFLHFCYPQLMLGSLTPYIRLHPCMYLICLNLDIDYCSHCLLDLVTTLNSLTLNSVLLEFSSFVLTSTLITLGLHSVLD